MDESHEYHFEWAVYVSHMESIIRKIGQKKEHGKSFDELAEMELFGRMISKNQQKRNLKL